MVSAWLWRRVSRRGRGVWCDSCTSHQENCKEDEKKMKRGKVEG